MSFFPALHPLHTRCTRFWDHMMSLGRCVISLGQSSCGGGDDGAVFSTCAFFNMCSLFQHGLYMPFQACWARLCVVCHQYHRIEPCCTVVPKRVPPFGSAYRMCARHHQYHCTRVKGLICGGKMCDWQSVLTMMKHGVEHGQAMMLCLFSPLSTV